MFNIQNISYRNLFCILNIYMINKPKTRKNVSRIERFYIKSVQYIEHVKDIRYYFLGKALMLSKKSFST